MATAHHPIITISPSSAPWLECLSRFHKLAVLKQYPEDKKQKSHVLRFGDLVHAVLKDLYDPQKPGELPHVDGLEAYLHLAVLRSGFEGGDREFALEKTRRLLDVYLKQQDMEDAAATVGVEVNGIYTVTKGDEVQYQLSARLDRILVFGGGARIVGIDYKTGAGSKLPPVSGVLVNLCALKAARPGAGSYEFRIESLSDSGVETTTFHGRDFRGQVAALSAQVQKYLAAEEYTPSPNEGCIFCPLRSGCKAAGQTVSVEDLEF